MAKKTKKATYNPMSYVQVANPGTYTSAYAKQLTDSRNQLMNYKYDPLQDANYQALSKIYAARGNIAAQDTLADAASLNGGLGTSYAVSAAQQARNQYNQELAAMIPELEANAYSRLQNNYNMLMDADTQAYQQYRDKVADYQWGKGLDMDIYQYKQAQKKSSGGGGRRRRSGGGGYSSSYGSTGSGLNLDSLIDKATKKANSGGSKSKAKDSASNYTYSINTGKYTGDVKKKNKMTK